MNNKTKNNEEIVFTIKFGKEEVQSFARANFGRELNDIELNRIRKYIWNVGDVRDAYNNLMKAIIRGAGVVDNEDEMWKKIDEDYIKSLKK